MFLKTGRQASVLSVIAVTASCGSTEVARSNSGPTRPEATEQRERRRWHNRKRPFKSLMYDFRWNSAKGGPFTALTTNRQLGVSTYPGTQKCNQPNDKTRMGGWVHERVSKSEREWEEKKEGRGTYLTHFTTELCLIYATLYFLTFSSLSLR